MPNTRIFVSPGSTVSYCMLGCKLRLILCRRTSLSCAPVCIQLNELDHSKRWFRLVGLVSPAAKLAIHLLNPSLGDPAYRPIFTTALLRLEKADTPTTSACSSRDTTCFRLTIVLTI